MGTMRARVCVAALFLLTSAALAEEPITEIRIIYGGSSGIAAPAGYTKIAKDLNAGAGGDYMYLCYKRGVGAPMTGLHVSLNSAAAPSEPRFQKINIDLNRHAGGDYIYLWTSKDPACAVIDDIVVLSGKNAAAPAGYTKLNVDLNRGAGGQYLYFAYHLQ